MLLPTDVRTILLTPCHRPAVQKEIWFMKNGETEAREMASLFQFFVLLCLFYFKRIELEQFSFKFCSSEVQSLEGNSDAFKRC